MGGKITFILASTLLGISLYFVLGVVLAAIMVHGANQSHQLYALFPPIIAMVGLIIALVTSIIISLFRAELQYKVVLYSLAGAPFVGFTVLLVINLLQKATPK